MVADVAGFWAWFSEHHAELAGIVAGSRSGRVTELIDRALAANKLELTYEVTGGREGAELTFTPCGDPDAARFIDRVLAAAPSFPGWKLNGRIQKTSLPAALELVRLVHGIDVADARFKFVFLEDQFHLCFLHDRLAALPDEQRLAIAGSLLDHALGEELSMEFIGDLEFRPAGEGISMALLINEIVRHTATVDLEPTP